jgi:hypothetical protein
MFPQMKGCLKGWVKKKTITSYTKDVIDYQTVLTATTMTAWVNWQPMPSEKVNKKPEEQRAWKWHQIVIDNSIILKIDDWITIDDKNFNIMEISDWSMSGFYNYEAIEGYLPSMDDYGS